MANDDPTTGRPHSFRTISQEEGGLLGPVYITILGLQKRSERRAFARGDNSRGGISINAINATTRLDGS
jgi:hypothetical protein